MLQQTSQKTEFTTDEQFTISKEMKELTLQMDFVRGHSPKDLEKFLKEKIDPFSERFATVITFQQILECPIGISHLQKFLQSEYSHENLAAYKKVKFLNEIIDPQYTEKMPLDKIQTNLIRFGEDFVFENSRFDLNVSNKIKQKLKQQFTANLNEKTYLEWKNETLELLLIFTNEIQTNLNVKNFRLI